MIGPDGWRNDRRATSPRSVRPSRLSFLVVSKTGSSEKPFKYLESSQGWRSEAGGGVDESDFGELEFGRLGFDTVFAFFQDSVEVGGQTSKRIMSSAMSESYMG